jgi:hypothetical protein
MRAPALAFVTAAAAAACGDDPGPACSLALANDFNLPCRDARMIALRETSTLVPSDDDILAVYEFLEGIRPLSCYFRRTIAIYEFDDPHTPHVYTTNPILAEPWSREQIATGNAAVDALFVERGAYRVIPLAFDGFTVVFDRPVSFRVLASEVAVLADTTVDLEEGRTLPHDIRRARAPSGDAWIVTFVWGWGGDCWLGCEGWHQWDVRVPDDGAPPAIIAEDGDDIPAAYRCSDE